MNKIAVIPVLLAGLLLGTVSCKRKAAPAQDEHPLPPVAFTPGEIPAPAATPLSRDSRIVSDVPYTANPHPRQRLDIYLPPGGDFPTVVFLHGGSWKTGDKNMYGHLGRYFSGQGIAVVIPNYRLSPEVGIADQTADAAKAVAWVVKNVRQYGGGRKVVLAGHSSGAHLAALLGTDPLWLTREGVPYSSLSGLVCFSGIYDIGLNVKLAGSSDVFKDADRKQFSPLQQVRKGMSPTLVVFAEKDYRTLPGQARDFWKAVVQAGNRSELLEVKKEDHLGVIIDIVKPDSPHGPCVVNWVRAV
jgi:acetyl esterase/lipase